ncbi:hypothetical protein AHW95_17130, partial [Salmonella enterica subsp. enterica]|nr:hypothetical protein [Salmonella enterica subsp. enterica]
LIKKTRCTNGSFLSFNESATSSISLYSSSFKLLLRWLRSFTLVTYFSKLPGIHSLAALTPLE